MRGCAFVSAPGKIDWRRDRAGNHKGTREKFKNVRARTVDGLNRILYSIRNWLLAERIKCVGWISNRVDVRRS